MPADRDALAALVARQAGVVSRGQLVGVGGSTSAFTRRVAAGRWQQLFPGVAATYTGPVAWRTRAWAAVLYAGSGAALSHGSAGYLHGFTASAPRMIDVSIPEHRRVAGQAGLVIHRRSRAPASGGRPAAVARGDTVLDMADGLVAEDDVVGLVCAATRARTWPVEILEALASRGRVRHRVLPTDLLAEIADGVESPLERRYVRDVVVRHRLPRVTLQVRERVGDRWIRADAVHEGCGVRAELDGALAHPSGWTDADTWRDNAVLLARGDLTLRYRWSHVVGDACGTAAQVEAALHARGWVGTGRPCGPRCPVGS
jgi:hypothetical protein